MQPSLPFIIWGSSLLQTIIDKISLLQRKAVRTITFSDFCAHTDPIFKKLGILKFKDNIFLQNCLLVSACFHENLPKSFCDIFIKAEESHSHNTRYDKQGKLVIPSFNTS